MNHTGEHKIFKTASPIWMKIKTEVRSKVLDRLPGSESRKGCWSSATDNLTLGKLLFTLIGVVFAGGTGLLGVYPRTELASTVSGHFPLCPRVRRLSFQSSCSDRNEERLAVAL